MVSDGKSSIILKSDVGTEWYTTKIYISNIHTVKNVDKHNLINGHNQYV